MVGCDFDGTQRNNFVGWIFKIELTFLCSSFFCMNLDEISHNISGQFRSAEAVGSGRTFCQMTTICLRIRLRRFYPAEYWQAHRSRSFAPITHFI